MRLIDADAVLDMMNSQMDMQDLYLPIHFKELVIDQFPTAYDVDKVVAELESIKRIMKSPVTQDCFSEECKVQDCTVCVIDRAIQIVKGGGIDG